MRRLMLLVAAGSLWLFLAAIPAFADGGPHIASENSGVSSLTTDSCAGCHRVHTAQAPMLLKTDEEDLCLSCHGAAVTGASTDVESGLQYAVDGNGDRDDTVLIGALRAGGFEETYIGDPFMVAYSSSRGVSKYSKIQVATAPSPVTSAHLETTTNGLNQPGIAWGNGANGSGAGPAATIGCASCHNPHGNGQYRILNPVPAGTGINAAWNVEIVDYGVVAANVFRSASSMGVINGDTITVKNNTLFPGTAGVTGTITMVDGPDGTAASPNTTPDDNLFTLSGVTTAGTGTGGTATRIGGTKVTDAANPTNATRNYTVIQTAASSPTLLASQAEAYDPTDGDYFHYQVPWRSTTQNLDAPNGIPGGSTASTIFTGGFNEQITAWCASCHTRYWAWSEPTGDPDGSVGPAYDTPRPGDSVFTYQHRTRGASGRACTTCHVSHGSSVEMTGPNSSDYIWPSQVPGSIDVDGAGNANSRLLKVDNRGTCVLCHDPSGTLKVGDQYPPAPYPIPDAP